MTMLQSLMSSVMSRSRAGTGSSTKADPNAAATRSLLANMVKPGSGYSPEQIAAVIGQAPPSVDTSVYATIMGMPTPKQKAKREFDNRVYGDFLAILNGEQPASQQATAPAPASAPPAAPLEAPQAIQPEPAPAKPSVLPSNIITKDFIVRKVLKEFGNFDVGAHYLEAPAWFAEHFELTQSGVLDSVATRQLAAESGFIPDGASELVSTPEDKRVLFELELTANLRNPIIHELWKQTAPEEYWDNQKQKTGWLLDQVAAIGQRYIPEHYQPFLDRFRGLEDPEFVDDETKTWIYKTTKKYPSEIEPSDVAKAQEDMHLNHIIETAQLAAARATGQTKALWEIEKSRPLSGEIRTKYGIGSEYSTFQDLADAGLRFPTEAENKEYRDLTDLVVIMEGKLKPLIDKIFTSQDNYGSRTAHGGRIQAAMALGEDLGITAQQYSRQLAIFSKKMLSMVERGGRFTDQDYQKMLESLPKVNFAMPDGKILAGRLIEDARIMLGQKLELYKGLIVKPIGQPTAPTAPSASSEADAAAQSLIDEYTKENK